MIHIKLIIMAILWAGGFIAGKVVAQQAGPFTISFIRFFVATLVMLVLIQKRGEKIKLDMALIAYAGGAAILGIACYNYFFFSGIKLVDAGRGSVMISMVPIVVVFISYVLFKERISGAKLAGIVFSLFGAWVVVSHGNVGDFIKGTLGKGEVYLIICVFCAAAFTLFSKQMLRRLSPMVTMACISGLGTMLLLVPAIMEMRQVPVEFGSVSFVLNLLYLSIGPSVIAVMYYYEAIAAVGPSRASQYMNLIPVFAVVLGMWFFGEQLSASLIVGGGLVTTGLYLTNLGA